MTYTRPIITTDYVFTVSYKECFREQLITINVLNEPTIFNSFSPNGDGYNDTWEIPSLKNFTDARVSVFDIWGQRIYDNIGYTQLKAWDGTLNGSAVPEGVYYYKIF